MRAPAGALPLRPEARATGSRWRKRIRAGLLVAIGVLYAISVPWYRRDDGELRLLLGLPDWVAVAVLCYAGVAVLNALAWLLTEVPDEPPREDGRP